ncbi:MAG: radical SAM protein [Fibrobacterota bacterium]
MLWDIIDKSIAGDILSTDEIGFLLRLPLFTEESALVLSAARKKSEALNNGYAEVHARIQLDHAPCPNNCSFCSFAKRNFNVPRHWLSPEEIIKRALNYEADHANAVLISATAAYPFERFIEMSQELNSVLQPETIKVANIGDISLEQAFRLVDCGYVGVYHAVRLGESIDTSITLDRRQQTFRNIKEAGLLLGTCLEPIGSEHTIRELVEKTMLTILAEPVFGGAVRRIPLPSQGLTHEEMVSEAEMAHILAVVRLALDYSVPGLCTYEPNVIGAAAGANLFWADSDSKLDTVEYPRTLRPLSSVTECRHIFEEAEWPVLKGPSKLYAPKSENLHYPRKTG